MRTAADIARERDGEILVLSAVAKSPESPVALFTDEAIKRKFSGDRTELLDRAVEYAGGVPVDGRLVVGRSVARALLRGVVEFDCDALLLGWYERRRRDAVFGNNVDSVVADAPCDVFVERIGPTADGVDTILLPVVESPHTDLAADVARAVATANEARVDAVHVLPADEDREAAEATLGAARAALGGVESRARIVEVDPGDEVAATLCEVAADYDLTVLGATRKGGLRRIAGTTPRAVGRRAPSTVIVARRGERSGFRLRVRQLLGLSGR